MALKEEEKWYEAIKIIHKEIENEVAENLAGLDVDENGVLNRKVKISAILFDEKKIKEKMKKAAKKLMSDTIERFGARAVKEANDAQE